MGEAISRVLWVGVGGAAGSMLRYVLHGRMGFGAHSRLHTSKILRLSEDLPIVIVIVDEREKIEKFLPVLDEMVTEGLVTLENVDVVQYRPGDSEGAGNEAKS